MLQGFIFCQQEHWEQWAQASQGEIGRELIHWCLLLSKEDTFPRLPADRLPPVPHWSAPNHMSTFKEVTSQKKKIALLA